jgi:hypothetical protein
VPRSNRRRDEVPELDVDRVLAGFKRTEIRRGAEWSIQPMSPANAVKAYICPGCGGEIAPGTAHLVAWRADGIMGEQSALAERRHWHQRCWELGV